MITKRTRIIPKRKGKHNLIILIILIIKSYSQNFLLYVKISGMGYLQMTFLTKENILTVIDGGTSMQYLKHQFFHQSAIFGI